MIPRRLFWLSDILVFLLAFSLAYRGTPTIGRLLVPGAPLDWAVSWLPQPPWAGTLPRPEAHLWILVSVAATALVLLSALGGHRNVTEVSRTRLIFAVGISLLAGL